MTVPEIIFHAAFGLLFFVFPAGMWWANRSPKSSFNFDDLLTENGRSSKFAVIILGTWWIHSCAVILWTLTKTVTTTDFVTYMGWAVPILVKMWAPNQPPAEPAKE